MDDPDDNGTVSRTEQGRPDLSGVWQGPSGTPLERAAWGRPPAELRDALRRNRETIGAFGDSTGRGEFGTLRVGQHGAGLKRTAAMRLRGLDRARLERGEADSWFDRNTWERCISRGMPPAALPEAHADHWQIFQTASLLAIVGEALHETRFIWLDRDTAAGPSGWLGYSTGRWTGDTLTATTTRFRTETGEAGTLPADPIPGMHRGTGSDLTLTETWTAAGRDAIDYEITLDDPSVYTVPVRYRYRLRRAPAGTALYEYACHEGNRSMLGILRGARHDEQRARTASRIGVAARAWGGHPGVTAPARPFLPRERIPLR